MKKWLITFLMIFCVSVFTFANYVDDLKYYKGKRVEVTLANNQKSETGIFKDTSGVNMNIMAIIIESDNGAIIFINFEQIASIKEIK